MITTLDALDSLGDYVLIDIREEYERANYFVAKAINVPMGEIMEHVPQLSDKITYVLFCQSGNRSTNMVKLLRSNGYANFLSLEGGATLLSERNYQ